MEIIETDILIVGGGTGGTAAAIQAARRGVRTTLVSEFAWLGGMLTTAGVTAPDGLELGALQTGIWGAFLQALKDCQPQGLDHAWVSFFTYEPQIGAAIFTDWVRALPNLRWIAGQLPLEVQMQGNRISAVRFADYLIRAKITLDATELGDLLALADIPYRWGWEWHSLWQEPSAPIHPSTLTQAYTVQAPTWVFVLQALDADNSRNASVMEQVSGQVGRQFEPFVGTWEGYGQESFLNYGRLPDNRFMINWPQCGNDYGLQADRLIGSEAERQAFLQDAFCHAQDYAEYLQQQLGQGYSLAEVFPASSRLGGGAFALQPYYRESRRLKGITTVREQDILPLASGQVAALPRDPTGTVTAIAIGNYANDHHYPGFKFALHPKSTRWGGRWTGTPFALPYSCLIPEGIDGLLVCEKNISVSHIANGATRLQPTVLGIGQAAGMAAALCVEKNSQPRELIVRQLQEALLQDQVAPLAVVPLFNLPPDHPDWLTWQRYYLNYPEAYPIDGNAPVKLISPRSNSPTYTGYFRQQGEQAYWLEGSQQQISLVTLHPAVNYQLQQYQDGQKIEVQGRLNRSGNWLLVEAIR